MFRGLWWSGGGGDALRSEVAAGTKYVEAPDQGTHADGTTGSR